MRHPSFFTLLVLLFFSESSFSQISKSSSASQVQIELLGPGTAFSINFDSRFSKKENGPGYRIGIGGIPLSMLENSCNSGSLNSFPAGINYLFGKNEHLIEIGAGGVLLFMSGTKQFCLNSVNSFFSEETEKYFFITGGYRYQPFKKKGITYRAFVSPLFQEKFPVKFWGGLSMGYRW